MYSMMFGSATEKIIFAFPQHCVQFLLLRKSSNSYKKPSVGGERDIFILILILLLSCSRNASQQITLTI